MTHAYLENSEWVQTTADRFRLIKNASIPDSRLPEFGCHPIIQLPRPQIGLHQSVERGALFDQDGFPARGWVITAKPLGEAQAALRAALSELRWQATVGGITLPDGRAVRTDDQTRASLIEALTSMRAGLITGTIRWKMADRWVDLGQAQLEAITAAVAAHVQACFAAEFTVQVKIDALTMAELSTFDLDAAFALALTETG